MQLKISSDIFDGCKYIKAGSVDEIRLPPQEQSDLVPHCLSKRLLKHFSRRQKTVDSQLYCSPAFKRIYVGIKQ